MAANVMAVIFVLVGACAGARYCWKTLTHRNEPRLATWLIFFVAAMLSLWSYCVHAHAHAHASFVASIANRFDVVEVCVITIAILISARHDRRRLKFKPVDYFCLGGAALIVVLWVGTGSSLWAYILLQILMCVAYCSTIGHLFKVKINTEPFDVWLASLGIALLALVPPLLVRPIDWLAIAYPVRAALCVLTLLFVMRHYHRRVLSANKPR
jgi:hypothetical protein